MTTRVRRTAPWRPMAAAGTRDPFRPTRSPTMTAIPFRRAVAPVLVAAALAAAWALPAGASSHREAPFIATQPQLDATDFYMFRSYEAGREQYVTIVANYLPLQDPYGGPNYFKLDPNAVYEIHITNGGSAVESLTFQFK